MAPEAGRSPGAVGSYKIIYTEDSASAVGPLLSTASPSQRGGSLGIGRNRARHPRPVVSGMDRKQQVEKA